jgi:hypothetical protein
MTDPDIVNVQLAYARSCEDSARHWLDLHSQALPLDASLAHFCIARAAENHHIAREIQSRYARPERQAA